MRKYIGSVLLFLLVACAAFAQSTLPVTAVAGELDASLYGAWSVQSVNSVGVGAGTMTLNNCYPSMGSPANIRRIFPFATNMLVNIVDGSLTETALAVTSITAPTANTASSVNPFSCSFTATFANAHNGGVTITSGDNGLAEAINDAVATSSPVLITAASGITNAQLSATTAVYSNVIMDDRRTGFPQPWTVTPATTTLLAAPTTLTAQAACDATHTFCSDATVAGSASWGGTVFGCITLVDINGNESPCSATTSFTSVASKAIDIGAPAAVTSNVVGWKPYLSVSAGSYALAYSIPLLTQPTVLLAVPVSIGVCTLTTLEITTPACAIGNTTYAQAASTTGAGGLFTAGGAQVTGYPVVTSTLAPEIGSVSATAYNANEEAHATYKYAPSARIGIAGVQSNHIVFPITAAAQTAVGEVAGTFPLPANFMNFVGRTIEVCGVFVKTSTTADTLTKFQLWWDAEGSNVTAGTPVQITNMQSTYATALAAAANFQFCQQVTTTVASTSATGGSLIPGQGWFTVNQVAAGANPSAGSTNLVAAVGSLNLSLPAHLTLVVNHTTATDGAGATLIGATLRIVN